MADSKENLFDTAIHPNMNGIAPGNAPTKTENEEIRLSGVYAKT